MESTKFSCIFILQGTKSTCSYLLSWGCIPRTCCIVCTMHKCIFCLHLSTNVSVRIQYSILGVCGILSLSSCIGFLASYRHSQLRSLACNSQVRTYTNYRSEKIYLHMYIDTYCSKIDPVKNESTEVQNARH